MKSLLDIQQDVRSLEKSVDEMKAALRGINADIENLRNVHQNSDVDCKKIDRLAKQFSFGNHPLRNQIKEEAIARAYLKLLLLIVRLDGDEENYIKRLVFIQWLLQQSQIDRTLNDFLKDSYEITEQSYYDLTELIPQEYRESFIVDALIVANVSGTANREILEYIADLLEVLNIKKQRLNILSKIVHLTLCKKSGEMKNEELPEFLECAKSFPHYVKEEVIENMLQQMRLVVVQLPDSEVWDFKWKVKEGQKVKKGDILAIYSQRSASSASYGLFFGGSSKGSERQIISPASGTIFQFRDNLTTYGVLAYEKDDKASIKDWVKERRQGI